MAAAADDSRLHWCTEEIPLGSRYYLEFSQPFTEPAFLGSLQREASWMGALPLLRTDTFDIFRLKYLVPTIRCHEINTSNASQIEQELVSFSQFLLQPTHAFIHLFTNFDLCDQTDYIPLNSDNNAPYRSSLPLMHGNAINPHLTEKIREIMQNEKLQSLTICEDVGRTGIGYRCMFPTQYNSVQSRFVVRATVEFTYPGSYQLSNNGLEILLMDQEWTEYADKIQSKQIQKSTIAMQQEKLWKNLFSDAYGGQSSSSDDSEVETETYRMRSSNEESNKMRKRKQTKLSLSSPFIFYDFSQNRYSSTDHNLQDIIDALRYSSTEALKRANMQREFHSKISQAHVFMVVSQNDLERKPKAYVYRLNILKISNLNEFVQTLNCNENEHKNEEEPTDETAVRSVGQLIIDIIQRNLDEFHQEVLRSPHCTADNFIEIIEEILNFLKQTQHSKERENLLLLQERAIIILADVIWLFYKRYYKAFVQWLQPQNIQHIVSEQIARKQENITQLVEQIKSLLTTQPSTSSANGSSNDDDMRQYYGFLEPFLKASNEKELQDFNECAHDLLKQHSNIAQFANMRYKDINVEYQAASGMRVGISSANASDNWTNSKLNGGVTINMSINLDSIQATPVTAKVRIIPNNVVIRLSTTHTMYGSSDATEEHIEFNKQNIDEFLKIDDNKDVFRMLKYALIFVGIIRDPHSDNHSKQSILSDVAQFTGGHGLSLSVINLGPSRSGFASSSAVACNLLKVLYACCSNEIAHNDELLGSMALLLENRLGLKSGRQDVDGLLPNGIKILHYNQTTGFVSPKISFLCRDRFRMNELGENMILVNSGIARTSNLGLHRGLNMRFLAYLSRDPIRFKPILQSYKIHAEIINALQFNNYCLLGKLFLDYMHCRERIDPGATQSKYDKDQHGERILRRLFDPLVQHNLIYGGMFTGAMGGGVAMLVLTPLAKQLHAANDHAEQDKQERKQTNIQYALNELKRWKTEKGSVPFQRLAQIEYSVNVDGILLKEIECEQTGDVVSKQKQSTVAEPRIAMKQYLLKEMKEEQQQVVCLNQHFDKVVLSLQGVSVDQLRQIKETADKGTAQKKDVYIVVAETLLKSENKITQAVSHAILL